MLCMAQKIDVPVQYFQKYVSTLAEYNLHLPGELQLPPEQKVSVLLTEHDTFSS